MMHWRKMIRYVDLYLEQQCARQRPWDVID